MHELPKKRLKKEQQGHCMGSRKMANWKETKNKGVHAPLDHKVKVGP